MNILAYQQQLLTIYPIVVLCFLTWAFTVTIRDPRFHDTIQKMFPSHPIYQEQRFQQLAPVILLLLALCPPAMAALEVHLRMQRLT